ncbi:Translation initiation factor IF-2, mitochondrial [Fulvia fulva]|nr:Translation initiation factor IF-2, mitochondrial [Fulvia fulva]KAK4613089.1 Translation initiation factor IF-2, mitochondrial [Fulvia fulva]WPV21636.1 Translation initiation factor IF-2, mitochondrial [Fulvia fulva]
MRRQRVLRTSSAQSLCVFCACRLGIEPLPSQITPFVSTTARRGIRTTPNPFQSAAPVPALINDSGSPPAPFAFDPTSSLTQAEQQEKARRLDAQRQRQRQAEEQQAKQQQTWQATEKRRQPSGGNASSRSGQLGRKQQKGDSYRKVAFRGVQEDATEDAAPSPAGRSLGQAMLSAQNGAALSQDTFKRAGQNRKQDPSGQALVIKKHHAKDERGAPPSQADKQSTTSRRNDNARRDAKSPVDRAPKKVANPFAAPAKKDTSPAEKRATSGWGMGATQTVSTAPEKAVEGPERGSVVWDDGVDRPPNPAIRDVDDKSRHEVLQARPARTPNAGGWHFRPTHTMPDEEATGSGRENQQPSNTRQIESNFQGVAAPKSSGASTHQTEPTQSYPDPAEVQSANTGSFGYFEDASLEVESEAKEQAPPSIQELVRDDIVELPAQISSEASPSASPPTMDSSNIIHRDEVPSHTSSQQSDTTPPTTSDYGEDELRRLQQELDDGEITQKGYDKRRAVIVEMQQLHRDFDDGEITQKGFDKRRAAILARQGIIAPAQASTGNTQSRPQMPDTAQGSRGTQQQTDAPFGLGQPRAPDEQSARPQEHTAHSPSPRELAGTGYRITPFDPSTLQQQTDQDQTADWQHLRPKKDSSKDATSEQAQPTQRHEQPQNSTPRQPRQRLQEDFSDAAVDRSFNAYRQSRPQRQAGAQDVEQRNSYELFSNTRRETRACARCGEIGHIARFCPDPHRNTKCHRCGQLGHMASVCPNQHVRAIRDAEPRRTGFERRDFRREQDATDQRYAPMFSGPFGAAGRSTQTDASEAEEGFSPSRESRFTSAQPEVIDEEDDKKASQASRRAQKWADVEAEPETNKYADRRKGKRNNRREFDEDADDDEGARDVYRARKAKRQAEEEAETRKKDKANREKRQALKAQQATAITLPEYVSVQQLSQLLGVRYEEFVERLEELGYDDVFSGKTLNSETSGMIAMEYNFEPNYDVGAREEEERDLKARPEVEDKEFLPIRPPVVTIMGHVDHGKTTILDYLRKSSVAAGEAGGITQHIGAFSVPMASSGKTVTFLDTPGHAAFLAMRQRGANVTDIVVLVVAADDSVKPQTLEAIKHAKAAGVPMIVAINKVDKEEADIQRCKQDLARHGVEIEDFGGDTQVVCVSGKTGKGMDELEESVVTLSEILDHRAETDGNAEGWILEATTKKAGRVATVLVRRGTLRPGSVIVAGKTWARVRSLRNEAGKKLAEVGPGMPVEVDGWKDQPVAGDEVLQAPSEQKATSVVEYREEVDERERAAKDMEAINEARRIQQEKHEKDKAAEQATKRAAAAARAEGLDREADSAAKEADEEQQSGQMIVPFIIKADVSGSAEAVSAYIMSVSNPLIAPQILASNVGAIHESDIELAHAASGNIIAFNLPADPEMQALAESRGVKVLENNIIYRVLDDVKAVLEEKLPPMITQRVLGEAEVGAAFEIGVGGRKKIKIAGCKVRNGSVGMRSRARVTRGGEKVYDGTITSLKNVKKDAQEMRKGTECGMGFDGWEGFEVGDQVQTYEEVSERRKL